MNTTCYLDTHAACEEKVHVWEAQAIFALLELEAGLEPLVQYHQCGSPAVILRRCVAGPYHMLHLGERGARQKGTQAPGKLNTVNWLFCFSPLSVITQ